MLGYETRLDYSEIDKNDQTVAKATPRGRRATVTFLVLSEPITIQRTKRIIKYNLLVDGEALELRKLYREGLEGASIIETINVIFVAQQLITPDTVIDALPAKSLLGANNTFTCDFGGV